MYEYLMNAPHILIGGTTGSGKSVLLNGIICELMESSTASKTRLYLIDPKRVELYPYSKTEYCAGYTEEADEVPALLDTLIDTINERFVEMRNDGLKEYGGTRIYLVIDELADLMISDCAKEIRTKLQKILQIGRAAGVHIIAATQAPNREIIPASLVLNFTDRIALRCLSSIESRQLINLAGAEKITGFGTALYLSSKGLDTIEIPYVSSEDIKKVCDKYAVRTIEWGNKQEDTSDISMTDISDNIKHTRNNRSEKRKTFQGLLLSLLICIFTFSGQFIMIIPTTLIAAFVLIPTQNTEEREVSHSKQNNYKSLISETDDYELY